MIAPVSPKMQNLIRAKLSEIAAEEDIRILFAVESGSRAWGFHSPDSDYDVRFVYACPEAWHYRLGPKRDVVERPIDAELDISGWELSKALTLLVKSNAALSEWLQSPIQYQAEPAAVTALQTFAAKVLDRRSMTWHYLSLLKRQHLRHLDGDGALMLKRYFYVLRPAITLRYMRLRDSAMPPMDMAALRLGADLGNEVAAELDALTERKMQSKEAARAEVRVPLLDALVADELTAAEAWLANTRAHKSNALWEEASTLHRRLSRPS